MSVCNLAKGLKILANVIMDLGEKYDFTFLEFVHEKISVNYSYLVIKL